MTWRAAEFRQYFVDQVGTENSANQYASSLRKIDHFTGGLDEKIAEIGLGQMIPWAKGQKEGPFEGIYASNARSALNRYVKFLIDASDPEASAPETDGPVTVAAEEATTFQYEKELQAAVRRQVAAISADYVIADGGSERTVATGRIDVLVEDAQKKLIAIELKAGTCPQGAMEQVLGYAEDLQQETGRTTEALLIAADFPERIRVAAKRTNGLRLMTYKLQLAFENFE